VVDLSSFFQPPAPPSRSLPASLHLPLPTHPTQCTLCSVHTEIGTVVPGRILPHRCCYCCCCRRRCILQAHLGWERFFGRRGGRSRGRGGGEWHIFLPSSNLFLVPECIPLPPHPTSIGISIGGMEGGSGGRKTSHDIHQVPFTGEELKIAEQAKGMNLLVTTLLAVGAVGER